MPTILDQIIVDKRRELLEQQARESESTLRARLDSTPLPPTRGFHQALKSTPHIGVIAEVKRRSPTAGVIHPNADAAQIAVHFAQAGATCISVLTDGPHFGGSLADLQAVRQAVTIPLLRKDFILEPYQVLQARLHGADAVLLIAEILDDQTMKQLLHDIHALGMDALVECYLAQNLDRVVAAGAALIGVNNRDLHTFQVDLAQTERLAERIPAHCTLVSESGIQTRADVERLAATSVQAVLVGETLMRAPNVQATLDEWRQVQKRT